MSAVLAPSFSPLLELSQSVYMKYILTICFSFCDQDEDHDPSEEYEEYLTCTVCGDHCMFIRGPEKIKP